MVIILEQVKGPSNEILWLAEIAYQLAVMNEKSEPWPKFRETVMRRLQDISMEGAG